LALVRPDSDPDDNEPIIVELKPQRPYVGLSDGFIVDAAHYNQLLQYILERLNDLVKGKIYTSKRLCGLEYWRTLDRWGQVLTGMCVAHMVVHNRLPLTFVKHAHEYPLKYQII
jgi:hypothetical protein